MTNEPQFRVIAERLLQRTRKGEVNWVEAAAGGAAAAYAVRLRRVGIVVKRVSPVAEPDYLLLGFTDERGQMIHAWQIDDPEDGGETAERANWALLLQLFEEARRHAAGWDKLLNEVETALAGQGPIGFPPAQK